jgi:uncharacterized protein involved in exopolysaccharide biosynthesis
MGEAHDLDLREQIARIDHARAESEKFAAEQRKLIAESEKLAAEQRKLFAEGLKFERERRWYIPLAILGNAALAAAIGAIVGKLLH